MRERERERARVCFVFVIINTKKAMLFTRDDSFLQSNDAHSSTVLNQSQLIRSCLVFQLIENQFPQPFRFRWTSTQNRCLTLLLLFDFGDATLLLATQFEMWSAHQPMSHHWTAISMIPAWIGTFFTRRRHRCANRKSTRWKTCSVHRTYGAVINRSPKQANRAKLTFIFDRSATSDSNRMKIEERVKNSSNEKITII
jgi:hypothetical protein